MKLSLIAVFFLSPFCAGFQTMFLLTVCHPDNDMCMRSRVPCTEIKGTFDDGAKAGVVAGKWLLRRRISAIIQIEKDKAKKKEKN